MSINFTVSYTFAPSTTISSSQVNTNTSDVANVFTGLEALTKTFAKLKVDVDPATALEVATKQYVDHYATWRRPVLQFGTVSTVAVESGLDGTSGDIPMLFPDGSVRTETSATRTTFNITRNCALSGTAQSGLRATLSEAANTWYALYAVKVTDSSTTWVTVGDTLLPLQANYSTLNTNFGANGWVYLGLIRNGDNSAATSDILTFSMAGNLTIFKNVVTGLAASGTGTVLVLSAGATSITYTYSAGTGTTAIPNNITHVCYRVSTASAPGNIRFSDTSNTIGRMTVLGAGGSQPYFTTSFHPASEGAFLSTGNSVAEDITLFGFFDGALGIGSNPLL